MGRCVSGRSGLSSTAEYGECGEPKREGRAPPLQRGEVEERSRESSRRRHGMRRRGLCRVAEARYSVQWVIQKRWLNFCGWRGSELSVPLCLYSTSVQADCIPVRVLPVAWPVAPWVGRWG